jgi:flavin-dependent dehydrogenase
MAATGEVPTGTRIVRRNTAPASTTVEVDICVLGAGISGVSAALEAAQLGRRVALIDGLPALGGQAVNSIIGTFCGLFANGAHGIQVTHGIADDILRELGQQGALHYRHGPVTTVVMYDEVALSRWVEEAVRTAGITVLLGAMLQGVTRDGGRIRAIDLLTRYGPVRVAATGFIDATGDAALAWEAGFDCREPEVPSFGTQMVVLEGVNEAAMPPREHVPERARATHAKYGLHRTDGFAFLFPGRGIALVNLTHIETPLEPVAASRIALEGKHQADRVVTFLQDEFPAAFGNTRVRAYGFPGIRQTRWIVGQKQLTVEEVRAGTRQPDAIARTGWPIELHDRVEGYIWQPFPEDHLHWVPLGSLIPRGADNLVAAGRCIDADNAALSSVRVMGPCIAMGAAAAHALDLAGAGSVQQIDFPALRKRLFDNLDRTD